jgi:hypothetical protein
MARAIGVGNLDSNENKFRFRLSSGLFSAVAFAMLTWRFCDGIFARVSHESLEERNDLCDY